MAKDSNKIRVTEAIKSQQNLHVQQLTVARSIKTPFSEDFVTLNRETRHEMTFHLRRMWALNLVQNMREGQGWDWDGIVEVTGKSRQTWNNVCLSKFSSLEELEHDDEKVSENARDGYRPVSNGFIRNVTDKIETYGWTVFTKHFRSAFDLGLVVMCPMPQIRGMELPSNSVDLWSLNRIGDSIRGRSKKHFWYGRGLAVDHWIDHVREGDETFVSFIKQTEKVGGDEIQTPIQFQFAGGGFPLLDCYNEDWGQHNCWEAHMSLEQLVFCIIDEETGEPDPRARELHGLWAQEREYQDDMDEFPEPPKPKDPDAYRVKPKKSVLKTEDVEIPKGKSDKEKEMMKELEMRLQETVQKSQYKIELQLKELCDQMGWNWEKMNHYIQTGSFPTVGDPLPDPLPDADPIVKSANAPLAMINMEVGSQSTDQQEGDFFPTVGLPFKVKRDWLNEDGEIQFKVMLSFDDDGNVDGQMIKRLKG